MSRLLRYATLLSLLCIGFAGSLASQAAQEPLKFTLVISAVKTEVPPGSDIVIAITITNISRDTINIPFGSHGNMPDGYFYEILDEQGRAVKRIEHKYGRASDGTLMEMPRRIPGSNHVGGFNPGEVRHEKAVLSDDYAFEHPGKYTIRVWKPATMGSPENPETRRIYSNIVTIFIAESGETN